MASQKGQLSKVTGCRSGVCKGPKLHRPWPECWLVPLVDQWVSHTVFSLQENAIGDEGASAVAAALKVNTALTAL